jgi:hypothetical protein
MPAAVKFAIVMKVMNPYLETIASQFISEFFPHPIFAFRNKIEAGTKSPG